MRFTVVFLLVSSQAVAASTIYKCPGPNGTTVFSDKECQGEVIRYQHPETYLEKLNREHAEKMEQYRVRGEILDKELAEIRRKNFEQKTKEMASCIARERHRGLSIGMPKLDLMQSELWSLPADVSTTTTKSSVREHWSFPCEGAKTVRLIITNGKLTSIHD